MEEAILLLATCKPLADRLANQGVNIEMTLGELVGPEHFLDINGLLAEIPIKAELKTYNLYRQI